MKKIVFALLLTVLAFCSCSRYYYLPIVQNVPLLQEKKDVRVAGFFSSDYKYYSAVDAQASYAFADNFGVMVNGTYANSDDFGNGSYVETGVGYFKPLKKINLFNNFETTEIFEVFAGFGTGREKQIWDERNSYADISGHNIFIQPSLGFSSRYFELAISARFCNLTFNKIDLNNCGDLDGVDYLTTDSHYLLQPALTLRGGLENIKLQVQAQYSANLNDLKDSYNVVEKIHCSVGLIVYF
jgi:hypothetical protein